MTTPELLAPAGTVRNLHYALAYGADAVYAGIPRYSLRVRENDFDAGHLATAIAATHDLGRRFYLTVNLLAHETKLRTFADDLAPLLEPGQPRPDALIMADPGLIDLVRSRWPEMEIHLSVQANTTNSSAVKFWQRQGIRRVILSRELSLDEIASIRAACPEIELEVFVHGALCIAYSGRCLLSGYFNHRDANQGSCTNACRWAYRVGQDNWVLEEANRPGDYLPIFEDDNGTYILNAKDLRAIEHVARLVELGVDCLKIEGRTKSHYYVARTTQVYRWAVDAAVSGQPLAAEWIEALDGLANRGYTAGFLDRHDTAEQQNYHAGVSQHHRQQFVGEISHYDAAKQRATVTVKNRFAVGDMLELITPEGNHRFCLEQLEDQHHQPLTVAPGSGWVVQMRLPIVLSPSAARWGLVVRCL